MKSPFPGMDPFLEDPAFWSDFHSTFIHCWREHIAERVPEHYDVRVGERVYLIDESLEVKKLTGPDVLVSRSRRRKAPSTHHGSATATLEPVTIPVIVLDGPRQNFIEILHRPRRSLVAVLELFSPSNKENPGWHTYLTKRNALLGQKVHIVELDLLLKGHRLRLAEPLPAADYYYYVSRADCRPNCDVYSWDLADPLPTVPVPLLAGDHDVNCDLSTIFATAFERGRYRPALGYHKAPPVKFEAHTLKWIKGVLRADKGVP
jgi:hypothetical protein